MTGIERMKLEIAGLRQALGILEQELALANAVASAASLYMVAVEADENAFDEHDALLAVLRPWREARAHSTPSAEGGSK